MKLRNDVVKFIYVFFDQCVKYVIKSEMTRHFMSYTFHFQGIHMVPKVTD